MEQIKKNKVDSKSDKEKLEKMSKLVKNLEQKTKPQTRKVKLKLVSSCGCGGNSSFDWIEREVAEDSPLINGDYVHGLTNDDIFL